MRLRMRIAAAVVLAVAFGAVSSAQLKTGKAELKSAGPLAFGPEGVLFVGDSAGAAVWALDTADRKTAGGEAVEIKGINEKVAALLGSAPDQIKIQDVAVNPLSKNIYLSVARGAEATPVILRADGSGKLSEVSLENIKFARVSLPDAPSADAKDRRGQSIRVETITDLGFVDGKVIIAGLSNEEFSSSLRSIPYPFKDAEKGASIEIFHGAHGRFETNAPVRTFVSYDIDKKPHILAAYTCTPLVRIPVSELKPGNKVKGADHCRTRQSQPSARHDRLQEGRKGLLSDGKQQPWRHEAAGGETRHLHTNHGPDGETGRTVRDSLPIPGCAATR